MSEYRVECRLDFVREIVARERKIEINNIEFRRVEDMILSEPVDIETAGEFKGAEGYVLRAAEKPYNFLSDLSQLAQPGVPTGLMMSSKAQDSAEVEEVKPLEELSKKELLELAKSRGLEVKPILSKEKIIEAIKTGILGEKEGGLESLSREELFKLAEDKGLPVGSLWTKEQLLEALKNAE